jgi:hypothetical protein|nr:MAG TPA: Transcriptional activator HlyU [Caudoviricetes sp.]
MTLLTALELSNNYPDGILIASREAPNGKFAVFCYMMRDGEIHKLMLSSQPVFDSAEEAENYMHEVAKEVKQQYS